MVLAIFIKLVIASSNFYCMNIVKRHALLVCILCACFCCSRYFLFFPNVLLKLIRKNLDAGRAYGCYESQKAMKSTAIITTK